MGNDDSGMENTAETVDTHTFFDKALTGRARLRILESTVLGETYHYECSTAELRYITDTANNICLRMNGESAHTSIATDAILADADDFATLTEECHVGMCMMLRRIPGSLAQDMCLQVPVDPGGEWYSCDSHYGVGADVCRAVNF